MYRQLVSMLNDIAKQDPNKAPSYVAMIKLRNSIALKLADRLDSGLAREFANDVSANMKIDLPVLKDAEMDAIVEPFATIVATLTKAMMSDGYNLDNISSALTVLTLELTQ